MFVSTRIAAGAVMFTAFAAMAQQPGPSVPKLTANNVAAEAPAVSAVGSPLAYRSVFEGYKGLSEQSVQPWRESNDTVGRIGGWQSYAREGQGGPPAGNVPPSEVKGMPGMPGMSGMTGDDGGMKMAPSGGAAPPAMAPAASTPGPAKAPVTTPPRQAKGPAGSVSTAMPADHTGHMKP